jgi:hypothetical protein
MPVLAMSAGRVTAIWGSAFVRLPDGTLKPLQVGDKVAGGERIVTEENGMVQISPLPSVKSPSAVTKVAEPVTVVDKAIAGVDAREPDQAPAAGLTGGADGGLQPGLRVERVVESEPGRQLSFDFGSSDRASGAPQGPAANQKGSSGDEASGTVSSSTPSALSINDVIVNEGAGTATFTITLDKPATGLVKVSFATGDDSDTAAASGDYVRKFGSVSFEPGQTSKTITVPIINDNVYEGSERFVVKLSEVTGNASIAKGTGVAEILDDGQGGVPGGVMPDDDRLHVVAVSSPSAPEGGELNFILKLAPGSDFGAEPHDQHYSAFDTPLSLTLGGMGAHPVAVSDVVRGVQYSLDGGDTFLPLSVDAQGHVYALDGSELVLHDHSPTTPIIVKVLTTLNDVHDGPQSIELSASSPFDTEPVHGVGTISDQPYLLVQSGEPVVEGQPVVFDVVLTYAIDKDLTIKLDLQSGFDDPNTPENESATAGVDAGTQLEYLDSSGQWQEIVDGAVTISAGQTLVQVRVGTVQDNVAESTEFIKLHAHIDEPGVTANTDHSNQTAIIDDLPYLLVQNGESAVEGQAIVFDLVLTHGLDQAVTIKLDLQSGVDDPSTPENESATAGFDADTPLEYQDASGQWHEVVDGAVTMDAWQTLLHVRVATADDGLAEDTEFIKLHASIVETGLTANLEHANQTAIVDNDLPYLLVQYGESAVEGQPIVFDVVLTHGLDQAVTIKLDLQSGKDDPDTPENESASVEADTGAQLEYMDASGQWHEVVDGAVTMDAWQTLLHVRVATVDDAEAEDTEFIKLHAAIVESGLTANTEHANQTAIVDNDLPYMLVQSGEPAVEGEPIVFDVTLTHITSSDVTVALALGDGIDDESTPEHEAATVGLDTGSQLEYLDDTGQWLALPDDGRVTFAPGETLIQVRVATNIDNLAEDTEYIKLNATVVDDGLTANQSQFNQTAILDKDSIPVALESAESPVGAASDVIDFSVLTPQYQMLSSTMMGADPGLSTVTPGASSALDLRDLLQGDNTLDGTGNLDDYLAFDANGSDAVIEVAPNAELVTGYAASAAMTQDSVQVIARLLDQGKLLADHG